VLVDEPASTPRPPAVKPAAGPRERTPPPIEARKARIALEVADPAGGPAWAMRTYETTLRSKRGKATDAECYEIGRLQGDTFGWVDGHGAFKPTQPGHYESPGDCPSPGVLEALGVNAGRLTAVTYSPTGLPLPGATVTWGTAEPDVRQVQFNDEAPLAVHGRFLDVRSGGDLMIARTTIERADGTRETRDAVDRRGYRGERNLPGTSRVAAVAPDPAGGRPWGILVSKGELGGRCFSSPGRLVGSHFAYVDARLDTLYGDFMEQFGNCSRKPPTARHPLRVDALVGGDALDSQGRIERRVIDGRIVYWGIVHPDVTSVTIVTPRDIRTLVPTRDHVFVAAYAGLFPGGRATAIAHLKDGREVRRSLHVE
jgi:hypothetical protein